MDIALHVRGDLHDAELGALHADYEPGLVDFYEGACGLRHTEAGLLRLDGA
ncbi:hypothetical protein [Cellulomonas terrae]|uniref:Uncharacterized protein n=1 Tax=Cellulomonas terrae TaxID=311234 RepID=A0A511JM01_9CELL|nr:hypothetical protein [Cellulomonas terrae]GEL98974.1 hypothetical protein CTE05_25210 [Cellulomonas terrae]